MKTEQDIKDKMLELYNSREAFENLTKQEREKTQEMETAFQVVEAIYTEKISLLNWVLNEK